MKNYFGILNSADDHLLREAISANNCSELMAIVAKWNTWYDIDVWSWIFLEAGEAKTTIDSHHTQVNNNDDK